MHSSNALLSSLALASMIAAAGCSADSEVREEPAIAKSELTRNASPAVSAASLTALVDGNTAFATDLYKSLVRPGENLFFSPQSISTALAMTYAGARGKTAEEMASVLHFSLAQEELHNAMNRLDLDLASRGQGAKAADGAPFRLRVTNSLWGQIDLPFEAPFLDTLGLNYGAGVTLADFVRDPETARGTINRWTEKTTEGRIKDLLPPASIDTSTRLVLVNAVYFNAAWASPFTPSATTREPFHGSAGDTTIDLMHNPSLYIGYSVGDGFTAVEIPYDGRELDMLAIVPDAGTLDAFEHSLDADKLASVVSGLQPTYVDLGLPKFRLDGPTFSVREQLEKLGMTSAFTEGADFGGITSGTHLYIDDVLHQAFVAVEEKGTEAAAATAVVSNQSVSMPPEGIKVTIDRPFVFAIRDRATGSIVFLGRIANL